MWDKVAHMSYFLQLQTSRFQTVILIYMISVSSDASICNYSQLPSNLRIQSNLRSIFMQLSQCRHKSTSFQNDFRAIK